MIKKTTKEKSPCPWGMRQGIAAPFGTWGYKLGHHMLPGTGDTDKNCRSPAPGDVPTNAPLNMVPSVGSSHQTTSPTLEEMR